MSGKDMACLCVVIVGIVLFMYGSNYYDNATGWSGIYLVVAGFLAQIVLKAYESLVKRKNDID